MYAAQVTIPSTSLRAGSLKIAKDGAAAVFLVSTKKTNFTNQMGQPPQLDCHFS